MGLTLRKYLITFSLVHLSAISFAGCNEIFKNLTAVGSRSGLDIAQERRNLIQHLTQEKVPAYMKTIGNAEIPVVLLTSKTEGKLRDYLAQSLGTESMTHSSWPNDHGAFRFGNAMLDAYVPGKRPVGEVNETGISWKNLSDYLAHHNEISKGVIEVSYKVTPDEMRLVNYYFRVRQAGIFRVRFTLGDQSMYSKFPNLLRSTGDHCFGFCKNSSLGAQKVELQQHLTEAGVKNIPEYLAREDVTDFLHSAEKAILSANPTDAASLGERMLVTGELGTKLKKILPVPMNETQTQLFADWLVGLDATIGHEVVNQALGISSDTGISDMSNPRVTAILVIDHDDKAPQFEKADYEMRGKFFHLDKSGTKPIVRTQ